MNNTEIGFYSFGQFGYFPLHIGGNGNSVEVFHLFSMYLKNEVLKCLKKQIMFLQFQETFHMYLGIGKDDGDDYNDVESSGKDY